MLRLYFFADLGVVVNCIDSFTEGFGGHVLSADYVRVEIRLGLNFFP